MEQAPSYGDRTGDHQQEGMMIMPRLGFVALVILLSVVTGSTQLLGAQPHVGTEKTSFPKVALELVAADLSQPLLVTYAPGDDESLYIVEKTGRVRIMRDGLLVDEVLLDLTGQVSKGFEQGLLSIAFHPRFQENGFVYVNYTDLDGNTQVERVHVPGGQLRADDDTKTTLLTVDQPAANHNGGMMAFGPDGYLYIGLGDGGRAGDPWGNAQNPRSLLGKMLRIDVDRSEPYAIPPDNPFVDDPHALDEIWAIGLRNPWRFSFDRLTGDLYIADVGQNEREEINIEPSGDPGGRNYGWNIMEGDLCYSHMPACDSDDLTAPVAVYANTASMGCSVTGGYVYRGSAIPELQGGYLFGDYCSGTIWVMWPESKDGARQVDQLLQTQASISSFGEDAHGELYVIDLRGGRVYRIVNDQ